MTSRNRNEAVTGFDALIGAGALEEKRLEHRSDIACLFCTWAWSSATSDRVQHELNQANAVAHVRTMHPERFADVQAGVA